MFKLISNSCRFATKGLLEDFGITNPNIFRNLTYFLIYQAFLNSMRLALRTLRQIPRLLELLLPAVELFVPFQAKEQGNSKMI